MARDGYRDSGVEWIEMVPEEWNKAKVGNVCEAINGFPFKPNHLDGNGTRVIRIRQLLDSSIEPDLTDEIIPEKYHLQNDDLVFSWSASLAVVKWVRGFAYLNQHLFRVIPDEEKITKDYLYYTLDSALGYYNLISHGATMQHLTKGMFEGYEFPLPPLPEQVRIAEYLDFETGKIDALVSELTEFSKTLKARTKSLIAECVTKGLPSGRQGRPMRDSGVEWPKRKIAHISPFFTGGTPPTGRESFYDGDLPWANISDVGKDKYIEETSKSLSQEGVSHSRIRISPVDSLLFSFKLSIGKVSLVKKPVYTNEAIATFLPNEDISMDYAYYAYPILLLKSANKNMYGADLLNAELINNTRIPLPPLTEQQAIADYLDSEVAKSDALIASVASLIEDLRVYRKALISEVVTGKRRV